MGKRAILGLTVFSLVQSVTGGPTLSNKLKYGTGVFLYDDRTEYSPRFSNVSLDFNKIETNKTVEIFSGRDSLATASSVATEYELRVYRPSYPGDKKISRWIEVESGKLGIEGLRSAHYNSQGDLDSYTDCRLFGGCSVLDAAICNTIVQGVDDILSAHNITLREMDACESKVVSIYKKMSNLNKRINENKDYQEKAGQLIRTLNAELPKMNLSPEARKKEVKVKKYEDTLPAFFSRNMTDYNECKELQRYFEGTSTKGRPLASEKPEKLPKAIAK